MAYLENLLGLGSEQIVKILAILGIISSVTYIISVICNWKIFAKAGQKKWACLIPVYNVYILIKASGLSGWYMLLYFIPIANLYAMIRVKYDLTKRFGYGIGMAMLYIFIPIIPMFIFAFKGTYTIIEKEEIAENINPNSALATDPVVDPFMNFTPVQGENAVPYEEGTVAYDAYSQVDTNVEIQLTKEGQEEKKEESKQVEEIPTYVPNIPVVPFDEGTVAYEQPKKMEIPKEVVVVKPEPVVENLPEPETIVIPTGDQIVNNVILPDGVKAPIVEEINQNVSNTKGEKDGQMKVCPKCGMKIDPMSDACFMCGTKF